MKTKLVNVRLPLKLHSLCMGIIAEEGYANFQEFIKDAIRHSVQESRKDKALINLEKNFGSTKGKKRKPFTKEIKERIALEHTPERAKELMKRFGLS
jgi:Arc/MetJ-type ribon-helix-helix transcriptional regulator